MLAIEADNLSKSFDGYRVLSGLSLRVEEGSMYGLLGPNGAGKSTLIHLLLGFLRPDQGSIRILGLRDPIAARDRVGYVPERLRYHLQYTGREYLRYLGEFSGMRGTRLDRRVEEELEAVGLGDDADRPLRAYSKGMLQRIGIAQALLHEPSLLLIDEPTTGLDPEGQEQMIALLRLLRSRGHSGLLATHMLHEAEMLCDRVGVLFDGRIAAEVEMAALRDVGRSATISVSPLPPDVRATLAELGPEVRCEEREVVISPNTPALQSRVLRTLIDAGVAIVSLEAQGRPLEELYLRVVRGQAAHIPVVAPADLPPPIEATPATQPRRNSGDTLLNELLQRDMPPNGAAASEPRVTRQLPERED